MAFDPDAVEAVAFDSYGTLVDVGAVEDPLAEHVDDPGTVAALWRNRYLGYAMVGNAVGEYAPFSTYLEHALEYALVTQGADLDDHERDEILTAHHELPAFDDVHDGIDRLRDAGYDCWVVSNGDEEMLSTTVEHAGLDDRVDGTVSAGAVERYKPEPDLYRHAADRMDVDPGNVAFVAAGWWDVPGALDVGMQGVWVNRAGGRWGPYETEPDLTVEDLGAFADEMEV